MVEFVSAATIAATIRLLRDAFTGSILIVEGPSDAKVYAALVAEDHCQIICACTKENVIGALDMLLQARITGVLGIVDADFSFLEGDFPATPGLFRTDTHDLENMILSSPAFDRVLAEFGSARKVGDYIKCTGVHIREALLRAALPVGYLRWVSVRLNLGLKFTGLDFRRFLPESIPFSTSKHNLITAVKNLSQRHYLKTANLAAQMDILSSAGHDPWQVCCGHDIVTAFSLSLRRVLGSNQANVVAPERLEQSLRLAYQLVFFRRTALFSALVSWENSTGYHLLPTSIP